MDNFNDLRATIVVEHMYVLLSMISLMRSDIRIRSFFSRFSIVSKPLTFHTLCSTGTFTERYVKRSIVSCLVLITHGTLQWNQRLFEEMYKAYQEGRMGSDPSTFWYKGELGFFDNYIIPLAKKLKECNVFGTDTWWWLWGTPTLLLKQTLTRNFALFFFAPGVSSHECLSYALQNRAEWEVKGEEIVAEMLDEAVSPRESNEVLSSVSGVVPPQEVNEAVSPREVKEVVSPRKVKQAVFPQEVKQSVSPRAVSPQQAKQAVSPREVKQAVSPREMGKGDDEEELV